MQAEFFCICSHPQIVTQKLNISYKYLADSSDLLLAYTYILNPFLLICVLPQGSRLLPLTPFWVSNSFCIWLVTPLTPPPVFIPAFSLSQAVSPNLFLPSCQPVGFLLTTIAIHIYRVPTDCSTALRPVSGWTCQEMNLDQGHVSRLIVTLAGDLRSYIPWHRVHKLHVGTYPNSTM